VSESACLRVSVWVCGGVSQFLSGVGDMLQFFLRVFEGITEQSIFISFPFL
jgi:hypothetical protein